MAKSAGHLHALLVLVVVSLSCTTATAGFNVLNFGAKPDGKTDNAKPFLAAWAAACRSEKPADVLVPPGTYLLSQAEFLGPCNNRVVRMFIQGTIVAPSGYSLDIRWLSFKFMDGLYIYGGKFDGRGQAVWACKKAGGKCPLGSTALTVTDSMNVLLNGIRVINSQQFHLAILSSQSVTVEGANIESPGNSPNTDGIHIQMSSYVTITGSRMMTGDDCISMGRGTTSVTIADVNCGPGHGISIGSLGQWRASEPGVENITVSKVGISGTQNGLRIKTWATPSSGYVRDVTFEDVQVKDVENPIIIDQNYCPDHKNCPGQSSGIEISQVKFINVQGSSATQVAVKLDCSPSKPCTGIQLTDINLTYQNKQASAYCKHAHGASSGMMQPPSCL